MQLNSLRNKLIIKRPTITYAGVCTFIIGLILFLLVAYNTSNLDYQAYYSNYNNLNWIKGTEYLYFALESLFKSLGFSFAQFKVVIALISYYLLARFVNEFSKDSPAFYLLYFVYPFFLDSIEIRHFLGLGIWLCGVSCLLGSTRFPRMKYLISIILAAGVQSMFLIFTPLVFGFNINIKERRNIKYVLIVFSLLSIVLMFLPSISLKIINNAFSLLGSFFSDTSRTSYYDSVHTNLGYLLFFAESLFSYFIFWMMYYDQECAEFEEKEIRLFEFAYLLSIFLVILLPLYRINGQFTRVTQASTVLFHVAVITYMRTAKFYNGRYKTLIAPLYCIYVFLMFFISIAYTHFDDIIINLFTQNSLWAG